jgi:apolipoprotein N-acyltransferase
MGFAPIVGVHGMTWLVLLTAGALVAFVAPRAGLRARAAAAVVLAGVSAGGLAVRAVEWTAPTGRTLDVALVQGAITQDVKWNPAQLPPTRALYAELTAKVAGADLIVWPEAAIPNLYEYELRYLDAMRRFTAEHGSTLMLGILRLDPRTTEEAFQNVLVTLGDTPQFYVKRHLVPFGEYFPVPAFVRDWMKLMSLPYTDAEPGDPGPPALDVAGEKVAVTICYEDVFGAEQLHYLPEATLLVNVSNDGWFGDSLAPHQHLQIARVRAAEAGRWLLRATNTGVSAVIDPHGRVAATIPLFEEAVLEHTVASYAGATPYARVGNYPVVLGALVLVLAPLVFVRWQRRGPPS